MSVFQRLFLPASFATMMSFRVIPFSIPIVTTLTTPNAEETHPVTRDTNFLCLISCVMARIC